MLSSISARTTVFPVVAFCTRLTLKRTALQATDLNKHWRPNHVGQTSVWLRLPLRRRSGTSHKISQMPQELWNIKPRGQECERRQASSPPGSSKRSRQACCSVAVVLQWEGKWDKVCVKQYYFLLKAFVDSHLRGRGKALQIICSKELYHIIQ